MRSVGRLAGCEYRARKVEEARGRPCKTKKPELPEVNMDLRLAIDKVANLLQLGKLS